MNFFEAMQAMNQGQMVECVSPNYGSIILRRNKIENSVVMEDGGSFGWSLPYCCGHEWRLYQPTVRFKNVPLGKLFKIESLLYGIKIDGINNVNTVLFSPCKNICGMQKTDDEAEIIFPVES